MTRREVVEIFGALAAASATPSARAGDPKPENGSVGCLELFRASSTGT